MYGDWRSPLYGRNTTQTAATQVATNCRFARRNGGAAAVFWSNNTKILGPECIVSLIWVKTTKKLGRGMFLCFFGWPVSRGVCAQNLSRLVQNMSTGSDHSCSGRSSSTSTSEKIISDGENSTSSVTTQSPTNNPLGLLSNSESPSSQLFHFYRRQTPEEDLLSTLSGIDILVKQRQELVDKLVQHHRKLYRSNEIENLLKFSQQIDSIMRYVW